MFKIIRGGEVYAPECLGKKDILIAGERIAAVEDSIQISGIEGIEVIDATGKKVTPGIVDGHIHIVGAGGGLGPNSRSTALHLGILMKAGVTTLVAMLGIDKIGFRLEDILMRCRAFEQQGITARMLIGSYTFPTATITDDVITDLCLVEHVIGTKIAMFEGLSSHPSKEMLRKVISDTYLGGRIGGKAAVVVSHIGDAPGDMNEICDLMDEMNIPKERFIVTHVNRTPWRLQQAIECGKRGLSLDLSGNIPQDGIIPAGKAYRMLLDAGVPEEVITFSSDSNAAHYVNGVSSINPVNLCIKEFRKMVTEEGLSLTQALKPITSTAADRYRLETKGRIQVGKDADILLLDDKLEIETVVARGRVMLSDYEPIVRGPLEVALKDTLE